MHAHYEQVEWGPIYLAAGVTTVRDVGNEFDFITAVRDAVNSGAALGPHMLLAGIVDGDGPHAIGIERVNSPADAQMWVQRYHDAGFQQMKIYSSMKSDNVRDSSDIVRLHGAVNLHLLKAGVVVALHPHLGVGGRVHALNADGVRAIAVDNAGQQHVRTERRAAVDGVAHGGDEVELVAHVAHRGNAGGEVDGTPLHLLVVGVHVPKAGNDVLARDIDALHIGGHLHFVAGTGGKNLSV